MDYKNAIEEYGKEFAAAVSKEEFNQFRGCIKRVPADLKYIDNSFSIDNIEMLGHRKVRIINEILYRMAEEF